MRPIRITVNAAKNSQWVPIDYIAAWFGVGLGVIPWSTASGLSATVQHTFDDIGLPAISTDIVTISRTTTTATVTDKGLTVSAMAWRPTTTLLSSGPVRRSLTRRRRRSVTGISVGT